VQIDMASGEGDVIQTGVGEETLLVLGADRVYSFDPDTGEVRSTELDGGSLTLEEELVDATDFGASPQGAYYVQSYTDPDTFEDTETLWFRATGATIWKKLASAKELEIHRSSPFGVVASEYDEDLVGQLLLLRGAAITALGEEPAGFIEAVATKKAVVAVAQDYENDEARLHWLTADSQRDYVIDSPDTVYDKLMVLGEEVATLSETRGKSLVRFFDIDGPGPVEIGIAPSSNVVYVDSTYVWYGVNDNWLESRFLRSQWFNLAP
jgi:hypothetical protein